ncbi:MAG TPA: KamA family radical SAM protein [Syntrophales bacterium]|nr:KamA family radical SAM protein [Syntrophales bacterium]HOX95492.1 KamA family radical SAM protein [Syntrophales bacterium]HPI55968.1 KamA family radical SAM protein [Syntrophales bacterium]HPN24142.1 KamA family radical SAM protein [Syntrophales bacterium]HQM28421.1 KamA family radical SAM protein [Syntrophales bacterium]
MKNILNMTKEQLLEQLWSTEPKIKQILKNSKHVEEARHLVFDYMNRLDRDLYNMKSDTYFVNLNIIEKRNAKECIRVLMNTMRSENEYLTKSSPLEALYDIVHEKEKALDAVTRAFLCEYLALFLGITGKAGKHVKSKELFVHADGREAALVRSDQLDEYASYIRRFLRRHKTGLDRSVVRERKALKSDILKYFGGSEEDWKDYRWHLKHTIKDVKTLTALVKLDRDELAGLRCAESDAIPFEITPYYLSLFRKKGSGSYDRQIRAQVIPGNRYCGSVAQSREQGFDMDFMGEKSTSPVDGITRRYPEILILKPYNACPQICVYCQRNWEIKTMGEDVMMSRKKIREALAWIDGHESITEVLITGGDPLTLDNRYLDWLIGEVAQIKHVERIRIGTRTIVTLPFRIDDGFISVIKKYHEWGKREIAIVTHFEHAAEVTPDAVEAVRKLKNAGINVYNQQVFTYYNSRKFETALLRKTIKVSGVDPYYTFSTKGKEETIDFRVPIARIEQERREEARLLPGLVRTDEPVFNVPKLGKSNLRAWQDHEVIMILPNGSRVYRFFSWEVRILTALDYLYTDVPIYDYLKRLDADGENINDYISIWYYF